MSTTEYFQVLNSGIQFLVVRLKKKNPNILNQFQEIN